MTHARLVPLSLFLLLAHFLPHSLPALPEGASAEDPSEQTGELEEDLAPEAENAARAPDCGGQGRSGGEGCGRCGGGRGGGARAEGGGQGGGGGCTGGAGGRGGGQGRGRAGSGPGGGSHGTNRPEVARARNLIELYAGIERQVEAIPGGVRTRTTSDDPATLEMLRAHVKDMEKMLREGGHIRRWDPLFAELLAHRELIDMRFSEIENGIEVTETSADPWVVELIRAHAAKVNEFVGRGWPAYEEPTPLPDRPPSGDSAAGGLVP